MDKKLMLFSERKELAEEYEKWINTPLDDGSKIKDCALSVITFMQIKGLSQNTRRLGGADKGRKRKMA